MVSKEITHWRKLPTCLIGYIQGPVRWEKAGGGEVFIGRNEFYLFQKPVNSFALTHLQRESRFGFLFMKPWCFYFWFQFRLKKKDSDGTWIPGSELGIYPRIGYRWEALRNIYFLSFYPPWNCHSD